MKEIKLLEFLNTIRMVFKELQTFEKFKITLVFCPEKDMGREGKEVEREEEINHVTYIKSLHFTPF